MKRAIIILLVIVALVAAGVYLVRGRSSRTAAAQTEAQRMATVQRGSLAASVEASGNLIPARRQTLSFGTSGQVRRILVREGDPVMAGTVLAELNTEDLALQVKSAEQAVAAQEAALARLKATPEPEDVAAARASVESARENLKKVQAGPTQAQLAAAEAALKAAQDSYRQIMARPKPEDIEQARLKLDQAKNSLWAAQNQRDATCGRSNSSPECDSAKAQVASAEASVRLAEIAYQQAQEPAGVADIQNAAAQVQRAQDELERLRTSPTAAELAAARAQVAQAEASLAKLLRGPSAEELAQTEAQVEQARISLKQARRRLEDARLVAPFDGVVADIGFEVGDRVGPNGPGVVLADLSGFHVDVQVDETEVGRIQVGQSVILTVDAFPDVNLSGQVTHISEVGQVVQGVVTYRVRVDLDPTDLPLRAEMTATATITVAERSDTLLVPTRALRRDAGGEYVEVLQQDSTLRKVYVRVGLSNDAFSEVLDGLREGDEVVIPSLRSNAFQGGPFGGGQ